MSFSVSPVSAVFATPPVAETQSTNDRDRHRAQDEASSRRQPHPHPHAYAETSAPGEPGSPPTETQSTRTLGTLIDVRA
jgi:hypothetical protein